MSILSTLFTTLMPLLAAVVLGVLLGRCLSAPQRALSSKALLPIVWVILWVIGISAGAVLGNLSQSLSILKTASGYALVTSLSILALLIPLLSMTSPKTNPQPTKLLPALITPVKEASIAFALVGLGVFCSQFNWQTSALGAWLININLWLYLLLLVIGIELAYPVINRSWLSPRVLMVPILAIIASLLGGALMSLLTGEKLSTALALSSGFGWFSLSGALAQQHLGDSYAAIALVTDLLRELLGILIVFLLGSKFPRSSIAVCGATAADTTLPFIRQACGSQFIPLALISGLVFTLSAPVLMLIFMSF